MPIVSAKCTNCGGNLTVDNQTEAAICPYCGSAYIVEKAINNYQIINHNNIDSANIYSGTDSPEQLFRTGMKYVNKKQYENARYCFGMIQKNYPSDYRGAWGRILCDTCNMNVDEFISQGGKNLDIIEDCIDRVYTLADENIVITLKDKYNCFMEEYYEVLEKQRYEEIEEKYGIEAREAIEELDRQFYDGEIEAADYDTKIYELEKEIEQKASESDLGLNSTIFAVTVLIAFVLFFILCNL